MAGKQHACDADAYKTAARPRFHRCNLIIGVVRHPDYAPKAAGLLGRLLEELSPPTPEWLKHLALRAGC